MNALKCGVQVGIGLPGGAGGVFVWLGAHTVNKGQSYKANHANGVQLDLEVTDQRIDCRDSEGDSCSCLHIHTHLDPPPP